MLVVVLYMMAPAYAVPLTRLVMFTGSTNDASTPVIVVWTGWTSSVNTFFNIADVTMAMTGNAQRYTGPRQPLRHLTVNEASLACNVIFVQICNFHRPSEALMGQAL